MTTYLDTPTGRRLAYRQTPGRGPGVVFLGGLRSDMEGTKALALEAWAVARGQAFLRFDYSGHGASSGAFRNGTIGDWFEDAAAILTARTKGGQVLVGSSMGGWIALLCAREMADRVTGLVTVAAAPDFTEDGIWAELLLADRALLMETGEVALPSDYSDEPYLITRRLIEEGRERLVLRAPLNLPMPVRMLQGTDDGDVPASVATGLLDHVTGSDIRLTLVKGADHRFSTPDCLALLTTSVEEVLARIGGGDA